MKGCVDMSRYINPGNDGFAEIVKSNYVDKTELIDIINKSINTTNKLICVSRPRRFGKSYAAKTISAYYDCSVDSHDMSKPIASHTSSTYVLSWGIWLMSLLSVISF